MFKQTALWISVFVIVLLVGCGSSNSNPTTSPNSPEGGQAQTQAPPGKKDPVTLTAYFDGVSDTLLEPLIITALEAKYPHITLQYLKSTNAERVNLNDLILSGNTPDIIFTYPGNLAATNEKDLLFDMEPFFKTHNFDLGRFEQNFLSDIKRVSLLEKNVAIPYTKAFLAMYYNKDILDRFAIPQPKPGMLFDEVAEIAKRVTRLEDGVQYRGFGMSNMFWPLLTQGMRSIDDKTEKLNTTPTIRNILQFGREVYNAGGGQGLGVRKDFEEGRMALLVEANIIPDLEKIGLNWNVTQTPNFADHRNSIHTSFNVVYITAQSKQKEQALLVLDVITSETVQVEHAKLGKPSPLNNAAVRTAFETSSESLKSKNLNEIFIGNPAPFPITTKYENVAGINTLRKYADLFYKGELDLNTAIMRASEEADKIIEQEKAKGN